MFLRYTLILTLIFLSVKGGAQENVKAKINRTIDITYTVKKVGVINSTYSEFSPTLNGAQLVFSSDRDFDLVNMGENRWKKKKFFNLYSSDITIPAQDTVLFSDPKLMGDNFHSINHVGPVCFTSDGKEAFLSQDEREYGHTNKPHLYQLKNENGKWSEKKIMPFVNDNYIFSHPAISDDGQTLYFVSDMPGGHGGKDIFYVKRNGDGWTEPTALGPEVNSSSDEMFPYFRNNVLYFSSNRSESIGGLDLFKSEITSTGKYKQSVTLGPTINSTKDDFSFILDKEMRTGFFASDRDGGKGSDDIYYFKVTETVSMISQDIEGKFNYKNLAGGSPEGMEVMLYDESGAFIGKAITEKDGYFRFQNLPMDKSFVLRTEDNGNNLVLTILDAEGEAAAFLLSDRDGSFIYKKLDMNYTGTLALMEVEDTEIGKSGKISGQFVYDKLNMGEASGLNVYLVDEQGNIVMKTITDSYGNFEFKKLPVGSNYVIKTDPNTNEMIMYIYNNKNEVVAQMRKNESGEFIYRKLNPDMAHISLMEANDSEKLAPKSNNIEGNFVFKNIKGSPANLGFEIMDDKGEIIYKGTTDAKGGFFVTGLPLSESYLFKISEGDPNLEKDMDLIITSRTNVKVATLVKDEKGFFVFKPLQTGNATINTQQNQDVSISNSNYLSGAGWIIYFELNSSVLSSDNKKVLDDLADKMKADKLIKLTVNAHTDSRADEVYNKWLSDRRLNSVKKYMNKKGIADSRIKGESFGEKQLVNKCTDGSDCSDEEHKANRRVELNFLK